MWLRGGRERREVEGERDAVLARYVTRTRILYFDLMVMLYLCRRTWS